MKKGAYAPFFVFPDFRLIIHYMKVLLFGSTGLLGSSVYEELIERGFSVLAPRRENVDLNDHVHLEDYLRNLNFDILINTAACSRTDYCEDHQDECFRVNWIAPLVMHRIAKNKGALFIHFSTDYVLDGKKKEYFEEDPISPISVYGFSKAYAENSIMRLGGDYYIIRTSLLYKENGTNFLSLIPRKILQEEEILCTGNIKSAPTYVPYLAKATLKLVELNLPFGIYHISGGYPMTACEFIKTYEKIIGKKAILKEVMEEEMNRKAKRPKSSFLNNFKFVSLSGFAPEHPKIYMRRIYESISRK